MVRNVNAGAVTIVAPQQITQRTMNGLDRQLDDAITQRVALVELNVAGTQIIDSAGLNWLLNAQSRLGATEIRLQLVEVPAIVQDVLVATRLDSRLTIVRPEVANRG
jgi:anti-anti-sigma factor